MGNSSGRRSTVERTNDYGDAADAGSPIYIRARNAEEIISSLSPGFSIVDVRRDNEPGNGRLLAESRMKNLSPEWNFDRAVGVKAVSNRGDEARGCIYGGVPMGLGRRVLGMVAGRAGMKVEIHEERRAAEVYLTEDEGLDVVMALFSRVQIAGLTYDACAGQEVSLYLPNDPLAVEISAENMTAGFTKDWRRRSALARKELQFEPGTRENLPSGDEGALWSLLLASGEALGELYLDLCVVALMDCTELTFVEDGLGFPTAGLLSVELLLATLSALTTKAGGRRVPLTTRCYCSALIQRYACASLAPAHFDFEFREGETSMLSYGDGGAGNLFWKLNGFIFKMPVTLELPGRDMHTLGPVCDTRTTLPSLSDSTAIAMWRRRPFRVGRMDDHPKLLDLAPLRRLVTKVASAEVKLFGEGAQVLFDAIIPPVSVTTTTTPSIPDRAPASTELDCPHGPRTLARKLGEGAGLPGWDASQRAQWIVLNWGTLAAGSWTSAGLEAMSFLCRFGTSCPLQVDYARTFGLDADGGIENVMASLDPEPWSIILNDKETAGLRGLICLLVDAERSQDVWTGARIAKGKCYAPVAWRTSCGTFTSIDPRGSPIVYGLRVLRGSDPESVEFGAGISGFTCQSRPGQTLWKINAKRTHGGGVGRTLHIRRHPSAGGDIVPCAVNDWDFKINGLIG
ncbi:unnamed protein product [Scytosiphon promiscuus]